MQSSLSRSAAKSWAIRPTLQCRDFCYLGHKFLKSLSDLVGTLYRDSTVTATWESESTTALASWLRSDSYWVCINPRACLKISVLPWEWASFLVLCLFFYTPFVPYPFTAHTSSKRWTNLCNFRAECRLSSLHSFILTCTSAAICRLVRCKPCSSGW